MVLFCYNETRKGYLLSLHSSVRPSIEHLNGAEQPNLGGLGVTSPATN